jgi:hypothetical protein
VDQEVREAAVVFLHAEATDEAPERRSAVLRHTLKHVKWLANKKELKNIVIHSFTHLGAAAAAPSVAQAFISDLADRLVDTGYQVSTTPFGYSCEWELHVYGDSLAKVWKEIQ